MQLEKLLADLRHNQIDLWLDGDRLRYRGRPEALTPPLLAELTRHRAALVDFLKTAVSPHGVARPRLQPQNRPARVPLSFAQQRLWVLDQLEPNQPTYNLADAVQLRGRLEVPLLERALTELLRCQEAWRTRFGQTEEGEPYQLIEPAAAVRLPVTDLAGVAPEARLRRAEQLIGESVRQPFDLARGPLVRFLLLRLAPAEHVLVWTTHHIISDGWSNDLFRREWMRLYRQLAEGAQPVLVSSAVQYADFALWQRGWLQGEALARQLAYWKEQLAGAATVLDLPADHARPPTPSYAGAHVPVSLSAELTSSLRELGRRQGATLFMTLLAGWFALLQRYTGQEDLLVGSPSAGRDQVETEGLLGFFVNTLVLRARLDSRLRFGELLRQVRETALGAFAHQDVPFERLVEELQVARDLSRSPLCQVMFILQNPPVWPNDLPGLQAARWPVDVGTEKFDLTLELTESGAELTGQLSYATDLFEESRLRRLAGHYQTLLAAAVANPDLPLQQLPLLTAAERRQILVDWNATDKPYPSEVCLHELFQRQVQRSPEAVALVAGDQVLTYRELDQRANQLAHHLQQLGVGPESFVGVSCERSLEMVIALYGVLKAGGAYVPIAPEYPAERVGFMLADANVPVLLTQAKWKRQLPVASGPVVCLDEDWSAIARRPVTPPASQVGAGNLAYMIYTSGSTGQPKGAMNIHRGIVNRLLWMQEAYALSPADVLVQKTPFSFDVSVWEFFWPLQVGARLVIAKPGGHQDPNYLVELIQRRKISVIHFVPSMLQVFLEADGVERCRSLCHVICSGEALPYELQQRFFEKFPVTQLHNLYGPTEAAVDVTAWSCQRGSASTTVPIGKPIANTQCYVLDPHLQPVPIGVPGELHLGGVQIGRGYHNRPELTAVKFIADPFRPTAVTGHNGAAAPARLYKTGDLARYLPDGNIEYLGRLDRQVKIRGFRIELGEIQAVLEQHPAVRETVVTAHVPQNNGSERHLVAYLVARSEPAPAVGELREFLGRKLPEYMVPAHFVFLPQLPLSPNGKVDVRALPEPASAGAGQLGQRLAPRNPLEAQLTRLWEKIFGFGPIGVRDDFFELGGHSLLAVRLFALIERQLGKRLPLVTLFQARTIEQLAGLLRQKGWEAPWWCLVPIKPDGAQLPFYCVHGVGGNILEYLDLAKYMDADQPFYGIQAIGLDGKRPRQNLTVEQMAAHYLQEIRAFQPQGPYYLGGSSFGGLVAYEMAQQLHAAGEKVGLLAFFDTNGPDYPQYLPSTTVWQKLLDRLRHRLSLHWDNLCASSVRERVRYVQVKAWRLGYSLVVGGQRRLRRRWRQLRARIQAWFWPSAIRDVNRAGHWAARDYRPQPYPGAVTIFRATQQPRHIREDRTLGWGSLVQGGITVIDTPGHHGAIVRDPRAKELARQLQEALRAARVR